MKILIPTDYSKNAFTAFEYAVELFGLENNHYIFLNVQNAIHAGAIMTIDLNKELVKKSHKVMDDLVAKTKHKYSGIDLQGMVTAGTFLDSVVEKSDELSVDFIVIGTKGASGVESVLMGSNAANLISNVTRPLLVIPQKTAIKSPNTGLLAANFLTSEQTDLFDPLLEICYQHALHLNILHVTEPGKAVFTEKDLNFTTEGLDYSFHHVNNDDVEYAIIDFVAKNNIDLIAMVKSKGGFIHDLFHSSLTKKLGMHADTPLLVLH